jgi:ribosomal protein S18 acetylase RimI-like enzyme
MNSTFVEIRVKRLPAGAGDAPAGYGGAATRGPGGRSGGIAQLLDAKLLSAQAVRARFFAVVVDGQVVAYADLYDDGRTAQIEDVATLDQHRGRGYASALVLRALDEARQSGCDLVFLVSDEDDWPKALYRRLGFDDLGRYVKFIRPG